MQRHEGIGECWGQEYHRCLSLEYKEGSNKIVQQRLGLERSGVQDQETLRGGGGGREGVTQERHRNGIWKNEFGVYLALVAKTSQEQEYCSALQLTSWVPLGLPLNLPGC